MSYHVPLLNCVAVTTVTNSQQHFALQHGGILYHAYSRIVLKLRLFNQFDFSTNLRPSLYLSVNYSSSLFTTNNHKYMCGFSKLIWQRQNYFWPTNCYAQKICALACHLPLILLIIIINWRLGAGCWCVGSYFTV